MTDKIRCGARGCFSGRSLCVALEVCGGRPLPLGLHVVVQLVEVADKGRRARLTRLSIKVEPMLNLPGGLLSCWLGAPHQFGHGDVPRRGRVLLATELRGTESARRQTRAWDTLGTRIVPP